MSYQPGQSAGLGALSSNDEEPNSKKKKNKTTKKVVNRQILVAGAFALLVAAGAAFFLTKDDDSVYVVRANTDIPALTALTMDLVEAAPVAEENLAAGSFAGYTAEEALSYASEAFAAGGRSTSIINFREQIVESDISGVSGLNEPLLENERILSIESDVVDSVAGQIRPGDRVDIYGTVSSDQGAFSGIVASNVPVIAVTVASDQLRRAGAKQQSADADNSNPSTYIPVDPIAPGIFVVRVNDEVASRLISVQGDGKLSLVYRDLEATDYDGPPSTPIEAICSGSLDAGSTTTCQSVGADATSNFTQ